jgi:ribosome-binding factor A
MAGEIKKIVGEMLLYGKLKDPRFQGMIAVSDCEVSGDGSYATLYITALSYKPGEEFGEDQKEELLKAFERSSGFIRSEIGKNIKVRYVPELIWKFDSSFEYGQKMDALLDSLDIKPAEEDPEDDDF